MKRHVLHPVLRRTPGQDASLPAPVRVENQRRAARSACRECARLFSLRVRALPQDDDGAPLPIKGWHWSLSHTSAWVGGVVFPFPVGLDLERVQNRRQELVRATASHEEFELLGGFRWEHFTRLWSAKEAVLKKARVGLSELSQCRLVAVPGPRALVIFHRDRNHHVHQSFANGHFVSICAENSDCAQIEWDWEEV